MCAGPQARGRVWGKEVHARSGTPSLWGRGPGVSPPNTAGTQAQANATVGHQPPPQRQSTGSRGATETQIQPAWDSRLGLHCSAHEGLELTLAAEVNIGLISPSMLRTLLERSSWN